jgi:hypothetical protein
VSIDLTVCFFLDRCSDDSRSIVAAAQNEMPFSIRMEEDRSEASASVGRARRRAMNLAVEAVAGHGAATLLTTDADTVLAPDWIARNLAALRRADVVTGDIHQAEEGFSPHHHRVKRYFDRLHRLNTLLDPVPWQPSKGHHHTGGASMAFSCDTYRALNGFPELARGEDAALVASARYIGLRVRHDATVRVYTSTRRQGRVEAGFAAHLEHLDEAGTADALEVVDPDVAAGQYRAHAFARHAFRNPSRTRLDKLRVQTGTSVAHLSGLLTECATAEAFATRAVPSPADAVPLPLAHAERKLARAVRYRR